MPQRSIYTFGPLELVGAAFSLPLLSLVIAVIIAGGILLFTARQRYEGRAAVPIPLPVAQSVTARYLPEQRALRVIAIAVAFVFAVENIVRGYVLDMADQVAWWRYATPVFSAFVGMIVILGMVAIRGTTQPELPVVPASRRTWTSFSPRPGLISACLALLALLATTIAAGLSSSADDQGRYIWLEIPVPNEAAIDPIRPWFYGWAYGVPVLICLAALSFATWAVLQRNAERPYIRPETVAAERDFRREVAIGAVRVTTAGILLALAGAWRFIASAGSGSTLVIEGQNGGAPYDMTWRYAELAIAAGWFAPILEITAFVLLLLVAVRPRRTPAVPSSPDQTDVQADAEAAL